MEEDSRRIVHQRVRNRIIEALEILADGDTGVRGVGFSEYFNAYYDFIPDHRPFSLTGTLSKEEIANLERLSEILDQACDAVPPLMSDEEFINTGWPQRIQPQAQAALACFLARGRFNEDREEDYPSS